MSRSAKWQLFAAFLLVNTVVSFAFALVGFGTRSAMFNGSGEYIGNRFGFDNAVHFFWVSFVVVAVIAVLIVVGYLIFLWVGSILAMERRPAGLEKETRLGGSSGEELCEIEPRCAGLMNHKGGHEWI